jgi:exonuclease VII large subunit
MKCLRDVAVIGLLLVAGSQVRGQEPPAPEGAAKPSESLEVRYARTQVELAQANLKRVESKNKRIANVVASNVVEQYRQDVEVAQSQLDDAQQGSRKSFDVWLRAAEANWKAADTAWRSAVVANKQAAGAVNPLDVERLRLRTQLYRIDLERGQALVDQPREAQLEWRVSVMNDEMERLKEAVFRSSSPRGGSLYWRF